MVLSCVLSEGPSWEKNVFFSDKGRALAGNVGPRIPHIGSTPTFLYFDFYSIYIKGAWSNGRNTSTQRMGNIVALRCVMWDIIARLTGRSNDRNMTKKARNFSWNETPCNTICNIVQQGGQTIITRLDSQEILHEILPAVKLHTINVHDVTLYSI